MQVYNYKPLALFDPSVMATLLIFAGDAECLAYIEFAVFRVGQLVTESVAIGNLESASFVMSGPVGAFYGFSDSTCISGLGIYRLLPGSEVKGQWPFA